jgi:hypothetical protein
VANSRRRSSSFRPRWAQASGIDTRPVP